MCFQFLCVFIRFAKSNPHFKKKTETRELLGLSHHVDAPIISDRFVVHDDGVVVVDEPVDGGERRSSSHLTAQEHAEIIDVRRRRPTLDHRPVCIRHRHTYM